MSLFNSDYVEEAKKMDVYELCEALKRSKTLIVLDEYECYSLELKTKAILLEDYELQDLFKRVQRGNHAALKIISSEMEKRGLL